MLQILETIKSKNDTLYYFGILMFVGGLVCMAMTQLSDIKVSGVNAYLKPMKFYFSVWIFVWTMGYYMQYLENDAVVKWYSWAAVITLSYEMFAITLQAARSRLSHFNIATPSDMLIFNLMGLMITIATLWTAYICYQFFTQKSFEAPMTVIWAIRLGIILMVIFAFEGVAMASILKHTVGAPDGAGGLPITNWSRKHGDLRVAHFFGMHALQAIPMLTVLFARNLTHVFLIAIVYFLFVSFTLVQGLLGRAFIGV